MPIVARSIISVLPILIGFALLAISLFWESERFKNFSVALFALFSMMNGDLIYDSYKDITYYKLILGAIFCYVYIFLSIAYYFPIYIFSVIQNIFVILIEEGYMTVKYEGTYEWLHIHYHRDTNPHL